MKWKHFPCYWPFVRGIHWSPVDSSDTELWCFLWSAVANNQDVGDFIRHRAHYDATVIRHHSLIQINLCGGAVIIYYQEVCNYNQVKTRQHERMCRSYELYTELTNSELMAPYGKIVVLDCWRTASSHYLKQCWLFNHRLYPMDICSELGIKI